MAGELMATDYSSDFESLPTRIFLDSSVLQALYDYGAFIWDNEDIPSLDTIHTVPDGYRELDALRAIFIVNQRAMFEFALSAHSLSEVIAKGDYGYLTWAYDVLDHWEACLSAYQDSPFSGDGQRVASRLESATFGYLSAKDRKLIRDALQLECDAFLTRDMRLTRNARHLHRELELLVISPGQLWTLLRPWAALFL